MTDSPIEVSHRPFAAYTGFIQPGSRGARALDVAICTFGILALELALIRWTGGQIRIVAYFANLILLAAFLGMGLGVVLGRRRPQLVHAALPALAVLSAILAFSELLHLVNVKFPDLSIYLWSGEKKPDTLWQFLAVTALVAAIFWAVTAVVALAAAPLGRLFDELPPLHAYTADIAGSLVGIIAFTFVSALGGPPWQWMALGVLPILRFSRKPLSLISAVAILGLAWYSARGALYSPYNRIELAPTSAPYSADAPMRRDWTLSVNRDYHQRIGNYSRARIGADTLGNSIPGLYQAIYDLPFRLVPGGSAGLVVGAGTGNDVAGALRIGYKSVTAVEIDPMILDLGLWLHPENPYSDPRVQAVNDDARAYFERNPDAKFDVIAYGLLDSHAMFSAMSSLRLDNYIYTVEGIRAGWKHVRDGGVLTISFSTFAGPWIQQRLIRTIHEATGIVPMLVQHRMDYGTSFIVSSRPIERQLVPPVLRVVVETPTIDESIRMPTDDWPFLYIRPGTFPFGYLTVLAIIGITAVVTIRRAYGTKGDQANGRSGDRGFDWPMFLMGAGFMLLETRMVTALSLLFGSTWIVNAFVFGGVLVMVLLANLFVSRRPPASVGRWFIPLLATVVLSWTVGAGALSVFGVTMRGVLGGVLFALPIGFAGIIVATLLARSRTPALALGSNLMGAVLGGILEYSSMFLGLRFVGILSLACYVGAFLALRGSREPEPAGMEKVSR